MTAQAGEILNYNGVEHHIATEPLREYLATRKDLHFFWVHTACWRGYNGKWEIIDKKLFLTDLKAYINDQGEVDLQYVFPGQDKVFAEWFTGEIRLPLGDRLKYVHMGYESINEADYFLKFKNGVLLGERMVDNSEEFK
ncbi:MAG TPA: hypothetical protein QF480_07580 [Bacteroidales bacterium]|jgi:hypothetical protein|nr:hypothetical protein [Bacteroidales bacterium]|tara:strand:+ start:1240 stop:1656 length:417 start_codon:yes stop_codon:yes gene_type:complete